MSTRTTTCVAQNTARNLRSIRKMNEATEYLKDLDAEAWESRDYETDDHAFDHHINADESRDYYEGLAESFPDGNIIADKLLGIGWEKLDNEYARDTKNSVNLYNAAGSSMFMKNMFTNLRSARDHKNKEQSCCCPGR